MSFKRLFSRSLGADPERLHFAAHSHHLWPDASFDGQTQAWTDENTFVGVNHGRHGGQVGSTVVSPVTEVPT